jgi:hypothetical protein
MAKIAFVECMVVGLKNPPIVDPSPKKKYIVLARVEL